MLARMWWIVTTNIHSHTLPSSHLPSEKYTTCIAIVFEKDSIHSVRLYIPSVVDCNRNELKYGYVAFIYDISNSVLSESTHTHWLALISSSSSSLSSTSALMSTEYNVLSAHFDGCFIRYIVAVFFERFLFVTDNVLLRTISIVCAYVVISSHSLSLFSSDYYMVDAMSQERRH